MRTLLRDLWPLAADVVIWILAVLGLLALASWALPAHAQTAEPMAVPASLSDLIRPGLWFLACAAACWGATEWFRGFNPPLFAPRPSTVKSRTLSRLLALFVGLLLGGLHLVPTLGADDVGASLALGGFAGIFASILSPFFGRFLTVVQRRVLKRAAGDEKTEPSDG